MFLSKEIDEKLILAFELYNQKMCESLPPDEELKDITFSEVFERKMQKLIAFQKKSYFYLINTVGKRVAIIVLALVISLTATAFSVKAIREAVIEFFIETFTTHSEVSVEGDNIPADLIIEKVLPQYLPAGYTLSRDLSDDYFCLMEYTNIEKDIIIYSQYKNVGTALSVDTEGIELKNIFINQLEGICYGNKGVNKIVFGDENYFYEIEGKIPLEELRKIAESIPLE